MAPVQGEAGGQISGMINPASYGNENYLNPDSVSGL